MTVILSENSLSLTDVLSVSRDMESVELSQSVLDKFADTRQFIDDNWMTDTAPLIYSFNTGVGAFKSQRIAIEDIAQFQTNVIRAHATGVGEPLTEEQTRAVMLLRLNAFTEDYSGVSPHVAQRFIDFLNHGITPVVPAQGSVGASGDLAPLAHLAGALCGFEEAEVFYEGTRMPASQALVKTGLAPELELLSKDASALINGSTVSLAIAVLALCDAENIARHADISLALSLEAMRCEKDAFLPELHAARPHPGQAAVARNIFRLVEGSERMTETARQIRFPDDARADGSIPAPRVQDSYSLRCAPQVHGPVREALQYARTILEREVNSATDNPLIVGEGEERRAVSGGHFHGQYVAQVMDILSIAMTDLGSIAERRVARLIDPVMSYGLPRNLASGLPGLNTGYATVQCSLSSLVMENRTQASPGSIDSIPGKGNAEDHVSNSTWCARKAAQITQNTGMIIAGEILTAAQALSMVEGLAKEFPISKPTDHLVKTIRKDIPARLTGDVWFAGDMAIAERIVKGGGLIEACKEKGVRL